MTTNSRSKTRPGRVSLERAFSKLGIASRGTARAWILGGKVKVNGVLRTNPRFEVNPDRARIEVDAVPAKRAKMHTYLFHKPRGVMTTHSDPEGRPTVFDYFAKEDKHLLSIGRLDFATSGLLLLTNDTRLSAWLTDPANSVPREYHVTVRGEISEANLARLRVGIKDRDEMLAPAQIILRKKSGRESHLIVVLTEGKNREIRRLFQAVSHEVTALKRTAFGGLKLGSLPIGKYRELELKEILDAFPSYPHKTPNEENLNLSLTES